jgi:hypothetical protein
MISRPGIWRAIGASNSMLPPMPLNISSGTPPPWPRRLPARSTCAPNCTVSMANA